MLLDDNERLMIILNAIRDYIPGENDIAILIVEKVCTTIRETIDFSFSTQDLYDEVVECFEFYNDFITEKGIDLRLIDKDIYELVRYYLNKIVEEL